MTKSFQTPSHWAKAGKMRVWMKRAMTPSVDMIRPTIRVDKPTPPGMLKFDLRTGVFRVFLSCKKIGNRWS